MKRCKECGETKPLDQFHVTGRVSRATGEPYRNPRCGPCRAVYRKAQPGYEAEKRRTNQRRRRAYAADPEYRAVIADRNRLLRYGVDSAWVEARVKEQGGCAVCGSDSPGAQDWHVDHDHRCCPGTRTCGKCLRGVLCGACNLMLGKAKDDPERLMAGAAYLMLFAGVNSGGQANLQAGVSRMMPTG